MIYEVLHGCCGCGTCLFECPAGAITISVKGGAEIDPQKCTGCGNCYDNCASEAIARIENSQTGS